MIVKLEFNLDDAEDRDRHKIYLQAEEALSAMQDYATFMRNRIKYTEMADLESAIAEEFRKEFFVTLENHNVTLEC